MPTILERPPALEELIDWRWPDALWVTSRMHSKLCYTVNVLDLDYSYTVWRAHLSDDGRWTLSPVEGPWDVTKPQPMLGDT